MALHPCYYITCHFRGRRIEVISLSYNFGNTQIQFPHHAVECGTASTHPEQPPHSTPLDSSVTNL
jgi:hypothetical protein